jgi:hypothetical protein
MSDNKMIETRLDRSLQKQIPVPKLDGRFNAAVWQRIAAQQAPAAAPRVARGSRWLMVSNGLGIAVSIALIGYVLLRASSGLQVDVELPAMSAALSLPEISGQASATVMKGMGWVIALVTVGFGFAFTSSGKRMFNAIRSF